jgi:hypothetical protein
LCGDKDISTVKQNETVVLSEKFCEENERGRMIADGVGILLEKKESASETHLLANGLQVSRFSESVELGAQTWKIQLAVS